MSAFRPSTDGEEIWRLNPGMEAYAEYARLIEKYGRRDAGIILMGIHLIYDPFSKLRETGEDDESKLRRNVTSHFFKERNIVLKWKDLATQIKCYRKQMLTEPERMMEKQKARIEKVERVLDEQEEMISGDPGKYMGLLSKFNVMLRDFDALYELVKSHRDTGEVGSGRGGYQKSGLEQLGSRSAGSGGNG